MIKPITFIATAALCAFGTTALAGGQSQQPAYVNDMPFPTEMATYVPRVVFGDLPFHDLSGSFQTAVFDDMPFPTEMKVYVPLRHYADMPTRADVLAANTDQAMLQIGN